MSNQKEWIDISKIDYVIVPSLGAIALFIYFVASHINLTG